MKSGGLVFCEVLPRWEELVLIIDCGHLTLVRPCCREIIEQHIRCDLIIAKWSASLSLHSSYSIKTPKGTWSNGNSDLKNNFTTIPPNTMFFSLKWIYDIVANSSGNFWQCCVLSPHYLIASH